MKMWFLCFQKWPRFRVPKTAPDLASDPPTRIVDRRSFLSPNKRITWRAPSDSNGNALRKFLCIGHFPYNCCRRLVIAVLACSGITPPIAVSEF